MKKFVLSCIMVVAFAVVGILPLQAHAETLIDSGSCSDAITWKLSSDGVLTLTGTGATPDYKTEPSPWYSYKDNITSAIISDGITGIGISTFHACTNMTSVIIPDSVTSIGDYAFYFCNNLKNITIPDGVTKIGDSAFRECWKLTSVTIPDSVVTIGSHAFAFCFEMTTATIGNGVNVIGVKAFCNCSSLTSVTIGKNVVMVGDEAFTFCRKLTSVIIPAGVVRNCSRVFERCFYDSDCDEDCNVCGTTRTDTAAHQYKTAWSNDATKHWYECSACKVQKDAAKHTPGVEATEENAQTCTTCGYILTPVLEHTHKYEIWSSDEINHWHTCIGCGEKMDTAAHEPGAEATATTAQTCTVCGYEVTPMLDGEEQNNSGATKPIDQEEFANSGFPWWIVIVAVAITGGIIAVIVIIKNKKKTGDGSVC